MPWLAVIYVIVLIVLWSAGLCRVMLWSVGFCCVVLGSVGLDRALLSSAVQCVFCFVGFRCVAVLCSFEFCCALLSCAMSQRTRRTLR